MGLFRKSSIPSTSSAFKSVKIVRDASGQPKVSLDKFKAASVSLSKSAETSSNSLAKEGLLGLRGQAVLVLDHSGSMQSDYSSGAVQALTEKALAFMLQFASDEAVTVIPFDSNVKAFTKVTLSNYEGVVDRDIYQPRNMGSTNLAAALETVRDICRTTNELVYCCIVTDGNPNSKPAASSLVCELAGFPVFIKFLALGNVSYLQELDDLGPDKRLLDNVDAKFFPAIASITDENFAAAMSEEVKSWMDAAIDAGVLTQ